MPWYDWIDNSFSGKAGTLGSGWSSPETDVQLRSSFYDLLMNSTAGKLTDAQKQQIKQQEAVDHARALGMGDLGDDAPPDPEGADLIDAVAGQSAEDVVANAASGLIPDVGTPGWIVLLVILFVISLFVGSRR